MEYANATHVDFSKYSPEQFEEAKREVEKAVDKLWMAFYAWRFKAASDTLSRRAGGSNCKQCGHNCPYGTEK